MNQPSLDFLPPAAPLPPYAGRTETARACSRAASVRAVRFAGTQRERALAWWQAQGRRGGTDSECSEGTGIGRASLCQRRKELMDAGELIDALRTRRNKGGYACSVYLAREFAPEA